MTGVARNVHKTVTEQYRKELETFASRLPQVINQVVSSTRKVEEIRKDFYGKYTDLDTPQLHPIVQQTATLVMQELKTSEYSPKVAETTAKRIYAMLGRPLPGQQPAAQPQVPPTFTGGGARPAAPSAANSVGDDIFNTLAPF
jgi:hypothetical protein